MFDFNAKMTANKIPDWSNLNFIAPQIENVNLASFQTICCIVFRNVAVVQTARTLTHTWQCTGRIILCYSIVTGNQMDHIIYGVYLANPKKMTHNWTEPFGQSKDQFLCVLIKKRSYAQKNTLYVNKINAKNLFIVLAKSKPSIYFYSMFALNGLACWWWWWF